MSAAPAGDSRRASSRSTRSTRAICRWANALYDEFQPGMTSLNGVALPYPGWVEQMTGCAPSVAQALRPYPQYCDNLQGLNENHGDVALQLAAGEAREALLGQASTRWCPTRCRRRSRAARTTRSATRSPGAALQGVISPFERDRNEAIAARPTRRTCCRRPSSTSCRSARARSARTRRRRQRAARRLADEHDLPLLVRPAALLPIELLQRAGPVPRRLHSGHRQPGRGVRPGQGQTSIRRTGRCSTRPRSSR